MRKILSIITIVLLTIVICSTQAFSQTGKWTQMFPAGSPSARDEHAMAYLGDDKILLFGGGQTKVAEFGDTWIYDLSDNEWTEVKCDSSPSPRDSPAMSNIGEGKVLLFGGGIFSETLHSNDTWIFDLKTMKWTELHPTRKPYRRYRAVSSSLGDNKVLLFSGEDCPLEYTQYQDSWCHDTWIFDLQKNEWDSITNDYPRGRELAQMCELSENKIILYGGNNGGSVSKDIHFFDISTKKWEQFYPKFQNFKRASSTMVNLVENITFVFGGGIEGDTNSSQAKKYGDDSWIFDYKDSTWIQIFPEIKPPGRYNHKMAKIGEGKGILFGGIISKANADETWLFEYDPTGVKDSSNFQIAQVKIISKPDICQVHISNIGEGHLEIELYDLNGNLVKNLYSKYNIQKEFNLEFSTAELQTNVYFLIIKTKRANYHKQIMVVH